MKTTPYDVAFPPPPIQASEHLLPITSWEDMFLEMKITGVDFDAFWDQSVEEGTAFFFRWTGGPRATVLVVWDDEGPTHVECRTFGDTLLPDEDALPIVEEVTRLFFLAGYCQAATRH